MQGSFVGACALALLVGLAIAAPASATGISPGPASHQTDCTDLGGNEVSCAQASTTASVQLQPFVLLSAAATGSPGLNASASLNYDFQVTGANVGDTVTLGLTTDMITSQTGSGSAFAQVSWSDSLDSDSKSVCDALGASACVNNHVFNGVISFDAVVGEVGQIRLFTTATSGLGGSGSASIDPQMFVMFDIQGLDTIHLSPGVSNALPGTDSVPEPATWGLMLAGFGLAGAALRRRTGLAEA